MPYILRPVIAVALLGAASAASAATLPNFLVADQRGREILIAHDRDGNGDANGPGEVSAFFSAANGSGLDISGANFFAVEQSSTGHVFANDYSNKSVYRMRDEDGDGTANDAGEAAVWFSAGNAAGHKLGLINGVEEGGDGAIYVTSGPFHHHDAEARARIYRTQDLNGDGDADDEGEATVWLEFDSLSDGASPFEIGFIGDTAYVSELGSGAVVRAHDANGDGKVDAGEASVLISDDNALGVSTGVGLSTLGDSIFLWEWVERSDDGTHDLFRLTDLNDDGVIDHADEAIKVWDSSHLSADYPFTGGFGIDASDEGGVLATITGGDAAAIGVLRFLDLDGDGLFLSEGETVVALNQRDNGVLPRRARAVAFYDGPAPVPAPAALPLLLAGLGGLCALRRRR